MSDPMSFTDENARMQILNMIDSGQITAEEGLRLLKAIENEPAPELEAETGGDPPPRHRCSGSLRPHLPALSPRRL